MNIILLGYNGLLGSSILDLLSKRFKINYDYKIICVGRSLKNKPLINKNIRYVKWDFINFSKSKLFFFSKKNIIINCVGKNHSKLKNLRDINLIFIQKLIDYIKKNRISAHLIHLSSVSVYNVGQTSFGEVKNITENSTAKSNDLYSKSKLEADIFIQNAKNNNNNFSFTILRVANVFSYFKNSNAFNLISFLLKKGIWFKCSKNSIYHFIHTKDVAIAVVLSILKLKNSRNKIYIVSDDINQMELHEIYAKNYNKKLLKISISTRFFNLIAKYFPLPKKIINFFFTISSEINYDNSKIKKELNFKTQYSLRDKII
ncbi:NAD(P)-dependent oxidoreductase [Candidatus Pelagibacter ubique]|nr:NAD(P)-dependent oxidoreductase [Candidatus Pelagibacter ubique]